MRTCVGINAAGGPCRAAPLRDGNLCRMHSPEFATDVAEARRLGGLRRRKETTLAGAYDFDGLASADQILRYLEVAAFDAIGLDNTPNRVRVMAAIAHAAVRVLETFTLEERIAALEATRPKGGRE